MQVQYCPKLLITLQIYLYSVNKIIYENLFWETDKVLLYGAISLCFFIIFQYPHRNFLNTTSVFASVFLLCYCYQILTVPTLFFYSKVFALLNRLFELWVEAKSSACPFIYRCLHHQVETLVQHSMCSGYMVLSLASPIAWFGDMFTCSFDAIQKWPRPVAII